MYKKLNEACKYINQKIDNKAKTAIILGSGLGDFSDRINVLLEIDYKDIPGFPVSTVKGHEGKLIFGSINDKNIVAMKGRFHYYEGYDMQNVVFGVRVMAMLGIQKMIITNAAGGIDPSFKPGDFMIIKDHIGLFAPSALRGDNLDDIGPRFFDMTSAYDKELIKKALICAKKCDIEIKQGVYAFAKGPMYETPSEIKALRILGADAVGMSTVPEVTAAVHAGINVLGISCISNMAAGVLKTAISHEEVIQTGQKVKKKFSALVEEIINMI